MAVFKGIKTKLTYTGGHAGNEGKHQRGAERAVHDCLYFPQEIKISVSLNLLVATITFAFRPANYCVQTEKQTRRNESTGRQSRDISTTPVHAHYNSSKIIFAVSRA